MSVQLSFADACNTIKSGDIVFIHRRSGFHGLSSIWPLVIELFTGSALYHCGVAMWVTTPGSAPILMLVESTAGAGKRIVPLWIYSSHPIEVMPLPAAYSFNSMETAAIASVGTEDYGYLDAISIALNESFGIKIGKFPNQVCSQLCADLWTVAGVPVGPDLVSPGKLFTDLVPQAPISVTVGF